MKIAIILLMSFCASIPKLKAQSDIESDIDFELYKHLDITPHHTSFDHDVDFDDEHSTFDSTYDGGGSENNENDENDSTDHNGKKQNANYKNDNDENDEENERTENDEGDNENDDDETTDETQNENVTVKTIDPKGTETVDPESFHYVSPTDVSHRLAREKRSKKTDKENTDSDYDFAKSYRDFVREHFGIEEANALSDDNKKQKSKKQHDNNEQNDDNGEVEEDEDYEEEAEDGETENDAPKNKSSAGNPHANEYYDEDDDDNEDDNNEEQSDDDPDSGSYEDEDYKNVKKLSQETDENPEFCKTVYKDNQECQVCKNPKTHDKSETCSYSSSPTPKRYAYKKEKNYHSNDDPDNINTILILKNSKSNNENHSLTSGFQPSYPYYHGYQDRRTTTPLRNYQFDENNDDLSFRASESFPVTASSETYDKDIDIFKSRDWSQCTRKINKEGLTCYYCKDSHGATQEECMYIAGNDENNPLKPKSNKNKKRNSDGKSKKKKNKKTNATISKSILTTTTTTTTTPTTIIPQLQFYDSVNTQNVKDRNILNTNVNIIPTAISSVSWQTNHNQQRPRILNRSQNFNNIPIPMLHQNINTNSLSKTVPYDSSGFINLNNNLPIYITTAKPVESPVKTLEYTEPRNRETLKRMIKLKISSDDDSGTPSKTSGQDNDATVFYSKVLQLTSTSILK
ncbi:uncharacterized protein DDB_G0290685-like [Condylostylus longicornis]|uniref:uncharacterized protein DDB_G0290685-like n=1 Tax=Condylostylus longicornis TaxID=2530218 RepID=UPI00244DC373|nr:uncharacterized protein DDB_G0290685-like [Condylostylus longicornis]